MTVQVFSEKNGKATDSPVFFTQIDYAVYMDLLLATKPDRVVIDFHLKKVKEKDLPTPLSCQCYTPQGNPVAAAMGPEQAIDCPMG